MKALISALRGEAVMFDDTRFVSRITAAGVEEVDEDSPFMSADVEDWVLLDDVTDDQVRGRLEEEAAAERLLALFLPLFDGSLSRSCRVAIAGELEDAMASKPDSIRKARDRFHSAPFPAPQRLEEALSIAAEAEAKLLGAFLRILSRRQPLIVEVTEAWAQIPPSQFSMSFPQEVARSYFVLNGSFARFVGHLADGIPVGVFHMSEQDRTEIAEIPNGRALVRAWTQPVYLLEEGFRKNRYEHEAWMEDINQWKTTILDLARRRPEGAYATAGRLRELQLRNGRPVHAAKTLCSLAAEVKAMGGTTLQHKLAALAVKNKSSRSPVPHSISRGPQNLREVRRCASPL